MKQEKMNFAQISRMVLWLGLIFCACLASVRAQTTAFTYQGRFTDSTVAQPTSGTYQMQFALYDSGGTQIGATVANPTVAVTNGVFTVSLDFGANSFDGTARLLEIRVFSATINDYVILNPRQPLTSSPYSIRTLSAASADGLSNLCVGCVQDANINSVSGAKVIGTVANATTATTATTAGNITGVVPILNGGTGSATKNFVDLTTAQTIAGNKTFSATLTGNAVNATTTVSGNIVNAGTQYNIGGNRVLIAVGGTSNNTFVGLRTGIANTSGASNLFVGEVAGLSNTTGSFNSFVGVEAGRLNTMGGNNAFFAGRAGFSNRTGGENSFFGVNAGFGNTTGNNNVFFGVNAGINNLTGGNNTVIGTNANVTSSDLTFATAIGAGAVVGDNDSVVLGRPVDTVRISGNLVVAGIISGTFGQSATTASGTGGLLVTNATTAYTLVPGLTQTVNVPANSSLLISTDGGILSQGAINTFSVIDVAIFVDGAAISIRRIVVSNSAVAASVNNWALNMVQTLSPGNRLIEVKVIYGNGQPALVSDGGDILLRGRLTVVVIKN